VFSLPTLLLSSCFETNHTLVRVTQSTSLFNYNLTNTSYAANNNLAFVPSYNHTITDPYLLSLATQTCSPFLSGSLNSSCASLFYSSLPSLFYQACLEDVAASLTLTQAEPGIVAFAELCDTLNSSLGIYLSSLPTPAI